MGSWVTIEGLLLTSDSGVRTRVYPPSASDPSAPNVLEGSLYYNTSIEKWMAYDSTRSKWLSVEAVTLAFGRNGNTAAGSFYRFVGSQSYSATMGRTAEFDGTVTAISYTRSDTDSADFEVTADGTTIATLNSTAVKGKSVALDGDFSADQVLGARNGSGGNTTSSVLGWVTLRWRA